MILRKQNTHQFTVKSVRGSRNDSDELEDIEFVETCIFLMGLFLIWVVRSVGNKTKE